MHYYIIIFIFIFLSYSLINILFYKETFNNKNNIPKIIHQTAPKDKKKWHPIWNECQQTWLKYFPEPEYKHIMWHDEDLDSFVKNEFPIFYNNTYKSYNKNIKKIDSARYLILYKYGGIYADMDYMCFKNFYDILPQNKISIAESPYKNNEEIQNALMISPPNYLFWLDVIQIAEQRKDSNNILYSTGPQLLTDVYLQNKNKINVLPSLLFNPHNKKKEFNNSNLYTKHIGTISWI
jgi:mannosyltransferase OCH1-like enzyme